MDKDMGGSIERCLNVNVSGQGVQVDMCLSRQVCTVMSNDREESQY